MAAESDTVHVIYGKGRAHGLREALAASGRTERVVALSTALNVGPIDPADPEARRTWIRANMGRVPERLWQEPEEPWIQATAPEIHPVYWVWLDDAGEHASFLQFAARMGARPFDVVDVTGLDDRTVDGVSPVRSLGAMRPQDILASGLIERRRAFTDAERETTAAQWFRLRRENAPLRIVRDHRLVSAAATHYDAVVLAQALPDWQAAARLIGRILHHLQTEADPPGQSAHEGFLFGRILALAASGVLDIRGDGPGMRDYEVRALAADDHFPFG